MNFYFNRLGLAASVLLVLRYIDPYGHSGTVPIRVSIWLTDNASALLITSTYSTATFTGPYIYTCIWICGTLLR